MRFRFSESSSQKRVDRGLVGRRFRGYWRPSGWLRGETIAGAGEVVVLFSAGRWNLARVVRKSTSMLAASDFEEAARWPARVPAISCYTHTYHLIRPHPLHTQPYDGCIPPFSAGESRQGTNLFHSVVATSENA
jgi:hypothetical protein